MVPHLGHLPSEFNGPLAKIDTDTRGHGQKSQDGGNGRQHYRPEAGQAGLFKSLSRGQALSHELFIIGDEHDGVVHHDPGQADHAYSGHHHIERSICKEQTRKYSYEREQD